MIQLEYNFVKVEIVKKIGVKARDFLHGWNCTLTLMIPAKTRL